MKSLLWFAVGVVLAYFLVSYANRSTPNPAAASAAPPGFAARTLERAITIAKAQAECGHSGEGGYAFYTPETAAQRLVETLNAANRPGAGERKPPGPVVSYALERPATPWQVVVIADPANKRLRFEGYGPDPAKPLITDQAPCG